MNYTKSETNNAIITTLSNVRKHPNADRIKLSTVFGTQIIVDLEARDGDVVVYFDSNLQLSYEYLHHNNLFSNPEMNFNKTKKGYFGKNGKVKAQKFRGEVSNGYAAPLSSLNFLVEISSVEPSHEILANIRINDQFTHINGVKICGKYVVNESTYATGNKRPKKPVSDMFWRHWETKQLMRESNSIPTDAKLYIEEKIHGTSGRTGHVLCNTGKRWWQFWKNKQEWKVLSGTRRVDGIETHLPIIRKEVEDKVASHLHKGEEIYYEIYGYDKSGKAIQTAFTYDCKPSEYKAMLYRITITTPDGYSIDLGRENVYGRADELGLEKPTLLDTFPNILITRINDKLQIIKDLAKGKSALDLNTLREGIVVWFVGFDGKWACLKYKSEEFLIFESKQRDEEIGDVEDIL